jgi:hypothetical protein
VATLVVIVTLHLLGFGLCLSITIGVIKVLVSGTLLRLAFLRIFLFLRLVLVALRVGNYSNSKTVFRIVGVVIKSTYLDLLINKDLSKGCSISIRL